MASAAPARTLLRSDHLHVGGLRIHHTHGGRGSPPILFIHGLGSAGYVEWRHNLGPLSALHRVFAPDLPGFGRSEKPAARYDIPYFVRALEQYMDACRLRSAAVVGISLGGRLALELALTRPRRLSHLVLVNSLGLGRPAMQPYYPLVVIPRVGEAFMGVARAALDRMPAGLIRRVASGYTSPRADLSVVLDDEYLGFLREIYGTAGFSNAYLATVRSLITPRSLLGGHDLTPRLGRLRMPVLLVWGRDDPLFPVAHAERAHQLIRGSRLEVIEEAGHSVPSERPEEFNRTLTDFLG